MDKDKKDKNKKTKAPKDPNKVTFSEKWNLAIRRTWVANGLKTFLIVAIIVIAYIAINIGVRAIDIKDIDVTENQIFTLTDTSKEAIKKIDKDVTIYSYGFDEKSSLIDLLKQYNKANDKIKFEILSEENNLEMIKENELTPGYLVLILKCGDNQKFIDCATEFASYDYTTGQQIDTTEQTITNSILGLVEGSKPKVYFSQGHKELALDTLRTLTTYLQNESFEVEPLNIFLKGGIPDDCDVLAITSPNEDFLPEEAQAIKDYIHRGGNIFYTMDVVSKNVTFPNIQSFLDEYGVEVKNGYILEDKEGAIRQDSPFLIKPSPSPSNRITSDIYTDSFMLLVYASKLNYKDEATLANLGVTKDPLLTTTTKAVFVNDIEKTAEEAAKTSEIGQFDIASAMTKKVVVNENGEDKEKESKLVVCGCGNFLTDIVLQTVSQSNPLIGFGSNKDFALNALSYLGEKENNLTIRKDMSSSTYLPTQKENAVVIAIITLVPVAIIITGVIVWHYRKKRK